MTKSIPFFTILKNRPGFASLAAVFLSVALFVSLFFSSPSTAFAWGGGHDVLASLLAEFLPPEIQAFLNDQNRKELVLWSHYPDMPLKSPAEIEEIVGPKDVELMQKFGMKNSQWLHYDVAQVVSLASLVEAFRDKSGSGGTKIAFYISELSHSFGDEGALNHTPINNILMCIFLKELANPPFSHITDVKFKITDLGEQPQDVMDQIRADLKTYKPRIVTTDFAEFLYWSQVSEIASGELSSKLEEAISYGPDDQARHKALAELGIYQMRLLLDLYHTAWAIAQTDQEIRIPDDWQAEVKRRREVRLAQCDARNDTVFRDLYETPQNPTRPETVGLILEPYTLFGAGGMELSFAGRLLTAAAGRSLRDAGYRIAPLNLPDVVRDGLPTPDKVSVVVLCSGRGAFKPALKDHVKRYLEQGGRIVWLGGDDRDGLTGPIAQSLRRRGDEELPISTKWGFQNDEIFAAMTFSLDGLFKTIRLPESLDPNAFRYRINPNIDGFGKPYCPWSVDLDKSGAAIRPLVWLDNGKEKFCVGACTNQIVWLPEYLIFPFVFSPDTKCGYPVTERLDSFGAPLILRSVELLNKGE